MARVATVLLACAGAFVAHPRINGQQPVIVEGTVAVGKQGQRTLQTPEGKSVEVGNPERLRRLPAGLAVVVEGSWETAEKKKLNIDKIRTQTELRWEDMVRKGHFPKNDTGTARLAGAVEEVGKLVDKASKPGALGIEGDAWDKTLTNLINTQIDGFGSLDRQNVFTARHEYFYREVVSNLANRRFHRRTYDNFSPEVYRAMARTADQTVGVAERGNPPPPPHGSGVLIGTDLVLTCQHNVGKRGALALEVCFRFDGKNGDRFPVRDIIQNNWIDWNGEPIDFALLRIGQNAKGFPSQQGFKPAELTLAEPVRDDPVYAVGHPEGDRLTVHDNASVRFPHRLGPSDYLLLEMLVCYELDPLPRADRDQLFKEFRDSYRKDAKDRSVFISERIGSRPALGIDAHTFPGNSGGPVFDRRTSRLVGIVVGGARSEDRPVRPSGWRFHELAVPISLVVDALDNDADLKKQEWRKTYGVTIHDDSNPAR